MNTRETCAQGHNLAEAGLSHGKCMECAREYARNKYGYQTTADRLEYESKNGHPRHHRSDVTYPCSSPKITPRGCLPDVLRRDGGRLIAFRSRPSGRRTPPHPPTGTSSLPTNSLSNSCVAPWNHASGSTRPCPKPARPDGASAFASRSTLLRSPVSRTTAISSEARHRYAAPRGGSDHAGVHRPGGSRHW